MYIHSTAKRALAIGGVSTLAVAGLIGWARHSQTPPATYAAPASPYANTEPVAPASGAPVAYAASPFAPSEPAPVVRQAETAPAPVIATATHRRTAVRRRTRPRTRVIVRKRPMKHSVAIVAGSAAGGAAIGALAGGGKGAAIGALAGGAGGLVYDRATAKKRVVVRR